MAAGKTVSQSSVRGSSDALNAVDGSHGTASMTARGSPPQWWMVDLGDDYMIEGIDIHVPDPAEGER